MAVRKNIPQSIKQQIAKLADQKFVIDILNQHLVDYYSDFKKLKSVKIISHKKHIGKTSAVFVTEYRLVYLNKDKQTKDLTLFSTGHSDGSRKLAYEKLKLLYANGFDQGKYTVTRPLFYLADQQGFFYEGSPGRSLFHFFSQDPQADLTNALKLSAGWVKQLHNLLIKQNFAFPQFAIANMIPPTDKFLPDFTAHDAQQGGRAIKLVAKMQTWEAKFNQEHKLGLIYGDYHPENVVINGLQADNLKMIDFTDVALGDPMIDLGTFFQQFYFMSQKFRSDQEIKKNKEVFLQAYFGNDLTKLATHFYQRINLYQAWTALRTAVFLFYQHKDNSVDDVLGDLEKYLQLVADEARNINLVSN